MPDLELKSRSDGVAKITETTLEAFRESVRDRLATAGSPEYDEARTIWNAMIDRRPALVIRCAGAADVRAVRFAHDHDLVLAVRGAGHNSAGNAVCDGGLVIDLSPMKSVRVDPTVGPRASSPA